LEIDEGFIGGRGFGCSESVLQGKERRKKLMRKYFSQEKKKTYLLF
jgi:hypothetical protein